jgi:plastocyanin
MVALRRSRRARGTRLPTAWSALALAGLAAATLSAPQAQAGTIRGRVEVLLDLPPPPRRPDVTELGMSAARDVPDRRRSVVYLRSAPTGAFEVRSERRVTMNQSNETFVPYVLAIQAGTVVDFPNSDPFFHNVFSLSKTKRFDLGRYEKGRSKSVRFEKPGVVRVFCDIHSHMSAFILVFAHRFFAVTDTAGQYEIANIPAGSYDVEVWTDGKERESRSVRVPDMEAVVEVDFVVR